MATTIKLKNGTGAPSAGALVVAEPALDLTNKRLYTEDSGGTVIEVGTNPGEDVTFADNRKAVFGADSDLQIYHDGSDSYITDTTGGNFFINEEGAGYLMMKGSDLYFRNPDNADMIHAQSGGYVKLYHNGAEKLATTSTGIDVTGTVTADGLTVDGNATFTTADNTAQLTLVSTDTDALVGPQLNLWRNSGTGTNGDLIGQITFTGEDTVGSTNTFASIYSVADQTNNGSEDGSIHFQTLINGVLADRLEINSAGNTVVTGTVTADGLTVDKTATISTSDYYGASTFSGVLKGTSTNTKAALLLNSVSSSGQNAFASIHSEPVADFRASLIGTYSADGSGAGYFAINQFVPASSATQERMRIDSSGSVGIGTSSPQTSTKGLHIVHDATEGTPSFPAGEVLIIQRNFNSSQGADLAIISGSQSGSSINFGDKDNSQAGRIQYDNNNNAFRFFTNGATERMRIDASGNLLVGKTNTTLATAGAEIRSDGFIRATVSDATCIQVNRTTGTGTAIDLRYAGTSVGSIVVGASSTTYNTSSDQRLKENIVDAPSASDDIDAIQVRSFDWKADGSHQKYGMVAQELNTVAPEAVSAPEDPEEMMGVDYSKLVPMLVKEIQSLRARVAELENN
jgi:hypothetical protein